MGSSHRLCGPGKGESALEPDELGSHASFCHWNVHLASPGLSVQLSYVRSTFYRVPESTGDLRNVC